MPGLPEPGAEWAGFQIEQRIGAGGSPHVFSAWDTAGDRRVVVKVLPPEIDAAARDRFVRESEVAAGLDHPGIVVIHDVGEHDGVAHVVMEHVGGGDLAQEIHVAPLTVDRTRSVVGQLAAALDHAHRSGLVHRGVEPANVLCVEESDTVRLTDFGAPGTSLRYAAPEQVRGEALTPATDVYGLGSTLFECLTGRVPFPGETPAEVSAQQLDAPPPRVTELRPDLPDDFDGIVARAMAKDPAERYPSTRHLAEAVALVRVDAPTEADTEALATTMTAVASPPPEETPVGRSVFDEPGPGPGPDDTAVVPALDGAAFGIYEEERRRSWVPAAVVGALVLATIGVGFLVWRAVNTDAELGTASPEATTTTEAAPNDDPVTPTVEALQALVPEGVDTCVTPEGEAAAADPIVFQCPIDGVPETLALELYSTEAARDARFDRFASELEIPRRDDAECALGRDGAHTYDGAAGSGRVLCRGEGGRVDFVWTRDDAPVLLHASGGGRFADYEQSWESMVGRTDAAFPTGDEQALLDALPEVFLVECRRDLTLARSSGGEVATACAPPDEEPTVISWVLFADDAPMDAWIEERRASLDENNFDTADDGCTPEGFGQRAATEEVTEPVEEGTGDEGVAPPSPGPPPDAAFTTYELDGSSGRVLCFINTSGQNALFWTRDGSRIGSIAVTDQSEGDSMTALLRWWRQTGYRP